MAYNTNNLIVEATESNLIVQKGYVEDINDRTFTAVLFDEDGEAEFRAKIPKKDGVLLYIGKMFSFSVEKKSNSVIDFYEQGNLAINKPFQLNQKNRPKFNNYEELIKLLSQRPKHILEYQCKKVVSEHFIINPKIHFSNSNDICNVMNRFISNIECDNQNLKFAEFPLVHFSKIKVEGKRVLVDKSKISETICKLLNHLVEIEMECDVKV